MSLATAPCTHCRTTIVYGQRRCHACGTTFDYGATPPPEPTPQQMQEALGLAPPPAVAPALAPMRAPMQRGPMQGPGGQAPAQQQPAMQPAMRPGMRPGMGQAAPVSVPSGAPVGADDDFLDRGRFDEVPDAAVQLEAIPGFVDSTLFKAFTPAEVQTEAVEGLEQTSFDDVGAAQVATEYLPIEHTAQDSVGAVQIEDIPGFVDSTLFKAFTPAEVQTEDVDGLEVSASALSSRARPAKKRVDDDGGAKPCSDCGTPHEKDNCPSCGARRK